MGPPRSHWARGAFELPVGESSEARLVGPGEMLYACGEALRVLASYDLSDAPAPRDQGTRDLTLVCNSLGDAGAIRDQILAENNR